MKNTLVLLGALLALPINVNAGVSGDTTGTSGSTQSAFDGALSGISGVDLRLDPATGIPTFIRAMDIPLAVAATPDHEARASALKTFVQQQAALFRMLDPANELALVESHSDAQGLHHYRFQQQLNGVPVRGAELQAHFNALGELRVVMARTVPTPGIDTSPAQSEDDVLQIARAQFDGGADVVQQARLEIRAIVAANQDAANQLVYSVESQVNEINRWRTVIDAHSGAVLRYYLDHHENEAQASGTDLQHTVQFFTAWAANGRYHLVDVTTPVRTHTEMPLQQRSLYGDTYVVDFLGTEGSDSTITSSAFANAGWDAAGVSAIINGQASFRYFRDTHDHHGTDDNNANLLLGIHYSTDYDNAFWNGKWMIFGDGGTVFSNLAGCLDIVGHEMSHGVVQNTAGLIYENQSGALNESIADLFGVLIEGRNWTLAEGCTKPQPGYLRNMKDPHKGLSWQPKHMSEYVDLPNTREGDWGGVHVNSGIPNRAAYLLVEGLSAEGMGESTGRITAEALYYRTLSTYLVSSSKFIDLRRALLLAADDLYAADDTVKPAIRAAFDAVGIVEAGSQDSAANALGADPGRLDFGNVEVGERKDLVLRVINNSDTEVVVSDVRVTNAAFSHSFGDVRIASGAAVEGTVSFEAGTSGAVSGSLTVITDSGEELAIELSANAVAQGGSENKGSTGGGSGESLLGLLVLLIPAVRRRFDRQKA